MGNAKGYAFREMIEAIKEQGKAFYWFFGWAALLGMGASFIVLYLSIFGG